MIASARMYSWAPSLAAAWRRLLAWVGTTAGVDLAIMDELDPTPLDDLLLARFDRVAPADFAVFLDRERAARDAGYPKLT